MRLAAAVLVVSLVIGGALILLVADGDGGGGGRAGTTGQRRAGDTRRPDRFDEDRAFALLVRQVRLGPRPAGSRASRRLARQLRRRLPGGRYQRVPGGLRNVIGTLPGRDPRRVVIVGAHYDSKDIRGFVGANDSAGGTAAVVELARSIRPRTLRPTLVFILFDGEESPRGTPDEQFAEKGLRGSKVAAPGFADAEAMILLDFIADRELSIPRETSSDVGLWRRLRAAARRAGTLRFFPGGTAGGSILDDHTPFLEQGVPSIDLIDFDFPCFHQRCDDLSAVSKDSLDASGETVYELLRSL